MKALNTTVPLTSDSVEQLYNEWCAPISPGEPRSLRDFLNRAYLLGREHQRIDDEGKHEGDLTRLRGKLSEVLDSFNSDP